MAKTREAIFKQVQRKFADELGFADREISEETSLDELGADEFDVIEVLEDFGIEIDADEALTFEQVKQLVDRIENDPPKRKRRATGA
jgi:acyl carrier protein